MTTAVAASEAAGPSAVVASPTSVPTPESIAGHLAAIQAVETAEASRASAALEAAWAEVERVIALNKEREDALGALDKDLEGFKAVRFWTPDGLGEKFGLSANATTANSADGLRIEGLTSTTTTTTNADDDDQEETVAPPPPPSSAGPSPTNSTARAGGLEAAADPNAARPTLSGTSKAKDAAHYAPASEKLAPIRRCFTSLLARRTAIPVEFTLLLNGLEQLQHRVVPVEERMSQSRFKLPLHVPFRAIAQLISRTLVPQPTGADLERWLKHEAMTPLKQLQAEYEKLADAKDPKAVYGQLDYEATERERIHGVCMEVFAKTVEVEANMREAYTAGHRLATEQCDAALQYVREHADQITSNSKSLVDEVDQVEGQGIASVDAEFNENTKRLKEAEYRAKRARRNQETAARQAREAMKAFHKEQQVHATAIADVARLRVEAARMSAAREQFLDSCKERREILADAHRACLFVNDVINDVADEVRTGLSLCQQHISRMLAEENYRKVRIATEPMTNAREWFRAVGDLKTIRSHRRADIQQRMAGSWQLEFLLTQEAQAHGAAIEALDARLQDVHREWTRLTGTLVDLEVHVPVLHQYDKDPKVGQMRAAFCAIEGIGKDKDMREVHRKLLEAEAAEAEERQRLLPPMPPVRTSKMGKAKQIDIATGVRHVPRPPSATSSAGGGGGGGDGVPATARVKGERPSRTGSASKRSTPSKKHRLATPPQRRQSSADAPNSRGSPPPSTTMTTSILPQRSPRGAQPLPLD